MYCKNCGKEINEDYNVCPYCQTPTEQNQNSNNFIPYFAREGSIYQKYPFLAWAITIIIIVVGLYVMYNTTVSTSKKSSYNAGYKSSYQE